MRNIQSGQRGGGSARPNRGRLWMLLAAALLLGLFGIWELGGLSFAGQVGVKVRFLQNAGQELSGWQDEEGDIWIFLPSGTGSVSWRLPEESVWLADGERVTDGQELSFGDGESCLLEERRLGGLISRSYTVHFEQSGQLPSLYLTTGSGSLDYLMESKENSESGFASAVEADGSAGYSGALSRIKGRGNYTWLLDKKSWSLSFEEPAELLGMSGRTEWVLIAGQAEQTHLISRMVFEMMREAGLEGVQESAWVDLYVNGEYQGNYLLSQKVELPDTDGTGNWMTEFDGYWAEEGGNGFYTEGGEALAIVEPDRPDSALRQEIEQTLQRVENAILSPDGTDPDSGLSWEELTDADSLVKSYVLDEISKCPDGFNGSNYCYLKEGRLYFGAPWDYELAFGNQIAAFSSLTLPEGLYHSQETAWYRALCGKEDFMERVRTVYRDFFRPYLLRQAQETIRQQSRLLASSMEMDARRWGRDPQEFERRVEDLCGYITDRLAFLDEEWLGLDAAEAEGTAYHTLRLMNGEEVLEVYYIRDGSWVYAEMLERDDAHFTGWYTDSACTQPAQVLDEPVSGDIVLYAGYESGQARAELLIGLIPLCLLGLVLLVWGLSELRRIRRTRRR
ncbi:MAG: CotH kinase family protein [Eubacteriales bacterium]|nr:CotH kinase family protein [Eubacteriales bacterium]